MQWLCGSVRVRCEAIAWRSQAAVAVGVCVCVYVAVFVPAGHVGLLMNERNEYLFAQPGMHNIKSCFMRQTAAPQPLRGHVQHGNRTIVIIEQGYIGRAMDNGQPVLLPPGIHVWTSESLFFEQQVALNDHLIQLGPYTLVTVDEGYAAVTQDNGKQRVLKGGFTHLLSHKKCDCPSITAVPMICAPTAT